MSNSPPISPPHHAKTKTGLATASLVLGLLGIFCDNASILAMGLGIANSQETLSNGLLCVVLLLFFGILGISCLGSSVLAAIFGHIALHKERKSPLIYSGRKRALWGTFLGYCGLVIMAAIIVAGIVVKIPEDRGGWVCRVPSPAITATFNGQTFQYARDAASKDGAKIVELHPPGQTTTAWSEMATLVNFPGAQEGSFVTRQKAKISKVGGVVLGEKQIASGDTIFDCATPCKSGVEYSISRIQQYSTAAGNALTIQQYSIRYDVPLSVLYSQDFDRRREKLIDEMSTKGLQVEPALPSAPSAVEKR